MLESILLAELGDDGSGEDPTVNELERVFASMVGKEAAVLVPSGVMANQACVRALCPSGSAVVAGAHSHVLGYEMGASAINSGVQFAPIPDDAGALEPSDVALAIESEQHHQPHIGLVSLENTLMYPGGTVLSAARTAALVAAAAGRPVHLDGARLFNAAVATGESLAALAAPATTVTACLSKGLCAPVGSVIAGSTTVMERVRVERKRLGGAMRQAGIIAAPGLVALRTMVERLADDHRRARELAHAVARALPEVGLDPTRCVTNIVVFDHPSASKVVAHLAEVGVLASTLSPDRVRFVTHAGVDDAMTERACAAVASLRGL